METSQMISDENKNKGNASRSTKSLANVLTDQDEKNKRKAKHFLQLYPELNTDENRAMIDNVKSLPEGIQIGSIVRDRNIMKPKITENVGKKYAATYDGETEEQVHIIYNEEKNIHQFSRWEANNHAKEQWLELPTDSDIEKSLKALPGNFSRENRYVWGNILALLLWVPTTWYGKADGEHVRDNLGYFWTSTKYEGDSKLARGYIFDKEKWLLDGDDKFACLPVVTVAKRF